jgi:hypothetical protein
MRRKTTLSETRQSVPYSHTFDENAGVARDLGRIALVDGAEKPTISILIPITSR